MSHARPLPPRPGSPRASERGIALAVVLVIMTIMSLLGVMLLVTTDANQLMARNERDVATCRQAAEAATRQGIMLSSNFYTVSTKRYQDTLIGCVSETTCPPSSAYMADKYMIDYPGRPVCAAVGTGCTAAWSNRLYINAGNKNNVYVTIYARNNIDGSGASPATPTSDKDGRVVIIGEAEMTVDGAVPTANRSNVRVRKMIAAEIFQSQVGLTGCASTSHNQGSNYGC